MRLSGPIFNGARDAPTMYLSLVSEAYGTGG